MSALARVAQKLFGSTAGATEIGQFGSRANGTPVYTSDPATIQNLAAFLGGWYDAVLLNNSPAIQDMNALFYLLFYQISYVLERGVPEWNSATSYYVNSMVSSSGVLYLSRTDDNLNNAVTDTTNWKLFTAPEGNQNVQINPAVTPTRTLTAADNGKTFEVNTANGAFALTLPAGSDGFSFTVKDRAGSAQNNPITITRVGSETIENVSSNYSCDKNYGGWSFDCVGTTRWLITENAIFTRLTNGTPGAVMRAGQTSDAAPTYDAQFLVDPGSGAFNSVPSGATDENRIQGHVRVGNSAGSLSPNSTNYRLRGNQKGYDGQADASSALILERGVGIYTPNLSSYTRQTSGVGGSVEQMKPSSAATDAIWAMLTTAIAGTTTTLSEVAAVLQNGLFRTAAGIQFPASQVASAGANDLDDYEEGTWTPTLTYTVPGTVSVTYGTRAGSYRKIGSLVFYGLRVDLSAFTKGTASGSLVITGLPFSSANIESIVGSIMLSNFTYSGDPTAYVAGNGTQIFLARSSSGSSLTTIADPSSTSGIWISGNYIANQ